MNRMISVQLHGSADNVFTLTFIKKKIVIIFHFGNAVPRVYINIIRLITVQQY